ncbi:MAG: hypothetical protein K0Q56_1030 [Sporolactobacillus laevolacticus]|jgi:hypothetical protein|nr:hypothetical protein [Sporolactobacillus laevolacticus]
MDQKKQQPDNNDDNFDRVFIGKPGCMFILITLAVLFIIYAIFIAK